MWVRSQDRMGLVPSGYIYIEQNELCKTHKTDGTSGLITLYSYDLHIYVDKITSIEIGTYATKERALEVLDEIQDAIEEYEMIPIIASTMAYIAEQIGSLDTEESKKLEINYKKQLDKKDKSTVYQMPKK